MDTKPMGIDDSLISGPESQIQEVTDPVQRALFEKWLQNDVRDLIERARHDHGGNTEALRSRHYALHLLRRSLELGEVDQQLFTYSFAALEVRLGLALGGALKCQRIGLAVCQEEGITLQEVIEIQANLPEPPPPPARRELGE